MNNRGRKNNGSTGVVGMAIVALVLLLNAVNVSAFSSAFGPVILAAVLALAGFAFAIYLAKQKTAPAKGSAYHNERSKEIAKRVFMREEFNEQAIKCTHPSGKEKYIHQLDNFLANGIIDRVEYRILKDRYEKANIPENMH